MIDVLTGSSGFLGKHLMQKIGAGALTVHHDKIWETAWPDCDRFFFLSTYGNMVGQDDIHEIIRANIGHLGYVLSAYIQESKCEHFTFISSSSVHLPVQTPYSHAKRAAEEMVLASCLPACVVRPFSIFGKHEQPCHLIPTLIRSCFEGELVQFAPTPVHDWIAVEDVVEGLVRLSEQGATGIVELGTGLGRTNSEVLEIVEDVAKKKANIELVKRVRKYDNQDWICGDTRAREFGWWPRQNFVDTIRDMIEDYKQNPRTYAI